METITFNFTARVQRRWRNGREYLVAPLSLLPAGGVLNGSMGALYYPPDEVARNVRQWDGFPLTAYHPTKNGRHLSASDPEAEGQRIGFVEGNRLARNGKHRAEGWFDAAKTREVDERIYNALLNGKPMELSTGLYTDNESATGTCPRTNRPYDFIARNYRPDHVAVLPDQKGACSIDDGCGVLVNAGPQRPGPNATGGAPPPPQGGSSAPGGKTLMEVYMEQVLGHDGEEDDEECDPDEDDCEQDEDAELGPEKAKNNSSTKDDKGKKTRNAEDQPRDSKGQFSHTAGTVAALFHGVNTMDQREVERQYRSLDTLPKGQAGAAWKGMGFASKGATLDKISSAIRDRHGAVTRANLDKPRDSMTTTEKAWQDDRAKLTGNSNPEGINQGNTSMDKKTLWRKIGESLGILTDNADQGRHTPTGRFHGMPHKAAERGFATGDVYQGGADLEPDEDAEEDGAKVVAPVKGGEKPDPEHQTIQPTENADKINLLRGIAADLGITLNGDTDMGFFAVPTETTYARNEHVGHFFGDKAELAGGGGAETSKAMTASDKAGTSGKGKDHKEAAAAHRSAAEHHGAQGNLEHANAHGSAAKYHDKQSAKITKNQERETMTANLENLTKEQRAAKLKELRPKMLATLTANCDCPDERKGLQLLNNETLALLVNASTLGYGNAGDSADDGEEDDDESDLVVRKGFGKKEKALNMEQRLTPDERQVWNTAKRVHDQEKARLLQQLTANVEDEGRREAAWNKLKGKDIDELRTLVELMPAPAIAANRQERDYLDFHSYLGAAGGGDGGLTDNEAAEVLDIESARKTYDPINNKKVATA